MPDGLISRHATAPHQGARMAWHHDQAAGMSIDSGLKWWPVARNTCGKFVSASSACPGSCCDNHDSQTHRAMVDS